MFVSGVEENVEGIWVNASQERYIFAEDVYLDKERSVAKKRKYV
jgi:hypothetical protein